MGLDITHLQVVPNKEFDSFTLLKEEIKSSLKDVNLLSENIFSRAFTKGIWEYVAVFRNDEELQLGKSILLNKKDGFTDFKLFATETNPELKKLIVNFEDYNQLNSFNKHIFNDKFTVDRKLQIPYKSISYEGELMKEVAYFKEIGYQRKGMDSTFYNFYENESFYCQLENFQKLLDFNHPNNHMYQEGNIQKHFLNSYIKGKSILHIDW
ncbi:hypothetical protein BTO06_10515 [Tenacibaculum sp. SZ-18]|uniref:hypothetical protein n=1 Tax=Tenacibaculum sp. SZ-18 TaxID=754423 RepID=UPI000C2D2B63|nr:hypothetical protein [Tenacibaculum sp. SZ-18]AUC15548.1 hypothetical protein BTO06_10515 [Tenacibaculum sp. SZ-18]